jgi:hypothetical protein
MITAERIQKMGFLNTEDLQRLVGDRQFTTSEFLGVTNGGEFCYSVTYEDPEYPQPQRTKVFVTDAAARLEGKY